MKDDRLPYDEEVTCKVAFYLYFPSYGLWRNSSMLIFTTAETSSISALCVRDSTASEVDSIGSVLQSYGICSGR